VTDDWYAQDRAGNVWYLGEDSSNFEHGRWVKDDGSWQAGVGNGQPGIIMLAHPHRGDTYRQEYSPGHAMDQAQVLGSGGTVRTPYRLLFDHVLTRVDAETAHRVGFAALRAAQPVLTRRPGASAGSRPPRSVKKSS